MTAGNKVVFFTCLPAAMQGSMSDTVPCTSRTPGRVQLAGGQMNIWVNKDTQATAIDALMELLQEHHIVIHAKKKGEGLIH